MFSERERAQLMWIWEDNSYKASTDVCLHCVWGGAGMEGSLAGPQEACSPPHPPNLAYNNLILNMQYCKYVFFLKDKWKILQTSFGRQLLVELLHLLVLDLAPGHALFAHLGHLCAPLLKLAVVPLYELLQKSWPVGGRGTSNRIRTENRARPSSPTKERGSPLLHP